MRSPAQCGGPACSLSLSLLLSGRVLALSDQHNTNTTTSITNTKTNIGHREGLKGDRRVM